MIQETRGYSEGDSHTARERERLEDTVTGTGGDKAKE